MTIRAALFPRRLSAFARALASCALLAAAPAHAQMAASLVADTVSISPEGVLTAQGNVEAFHAGTRLQADAVTFNRATERLTITGPILVTTPDGTIFTAQSADLDPQLENGLMQSARAVLNQHLQLAANQISRIDGRYSQFSRVAVTSCAVCGTETPLWDIRASRVTHDEDAQQLYFENAVVRVKGIPVLWVPAMRLPDPSVERATGLLIPEIRVSDSLGLGIALPYFIMLDDKRDLRLTPYISPHTTTLEMRFRQALATGYVMVEGAVSRDSLLQEQTRAYATISGEVALSYGLDVDFDFVAVSDRSYLLDYGISGDERLPSSLTLTRIEGDSLFVTDLTAWTSLRDNESTKSLPPLIGVSVFEQRQALAGGGLTYGGEVLAFARTQTGNGPLARDLARVSGQVDWRKQWIADSGHVLATQIGLDAQWRAIGDDAAVQSQQETLRPSASATLSYPLARRVGDHATQIFEPVVTLAWSDRLGDLPLAEDSGLSELDEGNLFLPSRTAGSDRAEEGFHLAIGTRWSHIDDNGDTLGLTFGRVLREGQNAADYSTSSGLSSLRSDWLLAGELSFANGLSMLGRTLIRDEAFEEGLIFGKSEARLGWSRSNFNLNAAYVWLPADLAEDRATDQSEWTLSGGWTINETWAINASGRYDISASSPARAGLGVKWSNECVTVDVLMDRRYTQTRTADSVTTLGISVSLHGFSAGGGRTQSAECNG